MELAVTGSKGGPQSQLLVPKRGVRIKEAVLKDIVG